ncbi:hypothetical protein R50073_00430 [Maricurvus nonylphenolicus]|uniref:hypothetical protein n=1 Tax=Maricurvus nonylphenolicus TaxID=1008307 RepID=UPI0036F226D9
MKKLGFLLVIALFAQGAFANKAGSHYTNVAVAVAETGVAASWAAQPALKAVEIDVNDEALSKQVEVANDKLNAKLEQRMAEMLEAKLYQ